MTIKILALLSFAFALAACGQSGPLYISGDPSSVQEPQPVTESEDNGDEDDEG